jgi:hypothetical protein
MYLGSEQIEQEVVAAVAGSPELVSNFFLCPSPKYSNKIILKNRKNRKELTFKQRVTLIRNSKAKLLFHFTYCLPSA